MRYIAQKMDKYPTQRRQTSMISKDPPDSLDFTIAADTTLATLLIPVIGRTVLNV
jgi:hypothetical protein